MLKNFDVDYIDFDGVAIINPITKEKLTLKNFVVGALLEKDTRLSGIEQLKILDLSREIYKTGSADIDKMTADKLDRIFAASQAVPSLAYEQIHEILYATPPVE